MIQNGLVYTAPRENETCYSVSMHVFYFSHSLLSKCNCYIIFMSGSKQAGSFDVVKFHSALWFHALAVCLGQNIPLT